MARYRKVRNNAGNFGWARMIPFSYVVPLVCAALANNGTVTNTITTDSGLPFILTEIGMADDLDTATLGTMKQWLASIVDGESQQLFSNGPVPRERMFGTRDFPRQLPSEVDITPSDQLTVTLTNVSGAAVTTTARVVFTGYKLVGFTTAQPE